MERSVTRTRNSQALHRDPYNRGRTGRTQGWMSSKRVYEIVDSEDEDDVVEVTSGPKKASTIASAASEPGKGRQGSISSLLPSWSYAEIEALRFACGGDNARSAEVVFKLSQNPDGLTSEMRRSLIAGVRASNPSPAPPLAPSPSPAQVSGKAPAWKRYAGESEGSFSGPSEGNISKAQNAETRPSPLPVDTFSTTGFRLLRSLGTDQAGKADCVSLGEIIPNNGRLDRAIVFSEFICSISIHNPCLIWVLFISNFRYDDRLAFADRRGPRASDASRRPIDSHR